MFHLSNSLVSGLSGVVASVSAAGPVISFEDCCTYLIKYVTIFKNNMLKIKWPIIFTKYGNELIYHMKL